jgi:hypothetical protein
MLTMLPAQEDVELYNALRKYDVERIEQVDLRPKDVKITYLFSSYDDAPLFEAHKEIMFRDVKEFYAQYGVNISFAPWSPGSELRSVPEEIFYMGVSALELFTITWDGRYVGLADVDERKVFQRPSPGSLERSVLDMGDTLIHEIGHAFTLSHTNLVPFDCVRPRHGKQWNIMDLGTIRSHGAVPVLHPLQVRQMHSYLGRGQIYEAMGAEHPDWHLFYVRAQRAIELRHAIKGNCAQEGLCLPCFEVE